jgi:hypothetical protein
MAKEFAGKSKQQRDDGKETFSVVMPNQPEQAANYRKVTGDGQKNKK